MELIFTLKLRFSGRQILFRMLCPASVASGETNRACLLETGEELALLDIPSFAVWLLPDCKIVVVKTIAGMMVPFLREYSLLQAGQCIMAESVLELEWGE